MTEARLQPWIHRLLITIALMAIGAIVAFNVVRRLRGLIVLLVISFFISIALEPAVNYLAKRGWRRGAATGLILGLLVLASLTFVALMVPLIVDQVLTLVERLPSYIDQVSRFVDRLGVNFTGERLNTAFTELDSTLQDFSGDVIGSAFGVGTALLNTVFQLLTIGLFTFYLTADGPRVRRAVCSLLPEDRQREVLRGLDIAIDKTGGYFYSRALLALIATLVAWVVFRIIGVPFALALAIWMGVLSQFVPVIGTYIGGALPVLIGLLESGGVALAVVIYVIAYQLVENYVLAPHITARTMELHPAIAFGAALAGGTLMGVPGALMALPAAATIQAFASTYLSRHDVVDSPLTEAAEDSSGG